MRIVGIIPARMGSTRFPGKALADIGGKSMVQRVWEQVKKANSLSEVLVATDDSAIFQTVLSFGGKAIMTSVNHVSGTDRCQEAYANWGETADYIINIQGDEPFINPIEIDRLASICIEKQPELATLAIPFEKPEDLLSPNTAKCIVNKHGHALYFSRSVVPYIRSVMTNAEWLQSFPYLSHIGMYAYRADILAEITQLPPSPLEQAESLEMLRWVENGYTIQVGTAQHASHGVDTPQDLDRVMEQFKHML